MDLFAAVAAKAVGAVAGAVFALVFVKPQTWGELIRRAVATPLVGVMLAGPVRDHLDWPPTDEATAGAALITAFASWWAAEAFVRLLRHYGAAK